jgi:hypothetical protein
LFQLGSNSDQLTEILANLSMNSGKKFGCCLTACWFWYDELIQKFSFDANDVTFAIGYFTTGSIQDYHCFLCVKEIDGYFIYDPTVEPQIKFNKNIVNTNSLHFLIFDHFNYLRHERLLFHSKNADAIYQFSNQSEKKIQGVYHFYKKDKVVILLNDIFIHELKHSLLKCDKNTVANLDSTYVAWINQLVTSL